MSRDLLKQKLKQKFSGGGVRGTGSDTFLQSLSLVERHGASISRMSHLSLDQITPDPDQPRQYKDFNSENFQSLKKSIKDNGVFSAILVRESPDNPEKYLIVFGERRFQAAKQLGLTTIPASILNPTTQMTQIIRIQLSENIDREDLNPIEEAEGYYRLQQEYGKETNKNITQKELALLVGRPRSTITQKLCLTMLPENVKLLTRQHSKISHRNVYAIYEIFKRKGEDAALSALNSLVKQLGFGERVSRDAIKDGEIELKKTKPVRWVYDFNDNILVNVISKNGQALEERKLKDIFRGALEYIAG